MDSMNNLLHEPNDFMTAQLISDALQEAKRFDDRVDELTSYELYQVGDYGIKIILYVNVKYDDLTITPETVTLLINRV